MTKIKYLIFCKERPLERPTIFWRTKLCPKSRSLRVTLFAWWDALRTLPGTLFAWRDAFFAEKLRKSRKNSEFRLFCEKSREIVAFFRKKQKYFRENKKLIFRVPNAKSVFDALCMGNT